MAEGKHSRKEEKKQSALPEKILVDIGGKIKGRAADVINGSSTEKKQSAAGNKKHGILYQMRWFLLLIVEIALVFGITRLIKYKNETEESERANAELAQAVTFNTPVPVKSDEDKAEDGSDAVSITQGETKSTFHLRSTLTFSPARIPTVSAGSTAKTHLLILQYFRVRTIPIICSGPLTM